MNTNLKTNLSFDKIVLGVIALISFNGCDPGTYYHKVVENHSSKDVKLIVNDYNTATNDTVLLKSGAIDTVY